MSADNENMLPDEDTTPAAPEPEDKPEEDNPPLDPNAGLGLDGDGVFRVRATRRRIPVEVEGDNGAKKTYYMVQMTGEQRGEHLAYESGIMLYDSKGRPQGPNKKLIREMELVLLDKSIYHDQAGKKAVGKAHIATWSSEATDALARLAERINCLGKEEVRKNMEDMESRAKKS